MYVLKGRNPRKNPNTDKDLWCLDLNSFTWTLCQSSGEKPGSSTLSHLLNSVETRNERNSFIVQDNLYIYGDIRQNLGETLTKDIYVLNLTSMNWTKLEQKEIFLTNRPDRLPLVSAFSKDHDHLIIGEGLKTGENPEKDRLCCWNRKTNSWSTFDIQREHTEYSYEIYSWIVYNNLLLSPWFEQQKNGIYIMNLDHVVGLSVPESPEQKHLKSLFMNEEESDIKFQIQDKIIPSHKQVLIEKSKFFANLFNSGMAESKQDIIEVSDCEFLVFKEYLRFLYCEKVQLDENLAFKLLALADKYVQDDLSAKCMNFLMYNVNMKNVYTILDLARQEEISYLSHQCLTFLKDKTDLQNIAGTIEYLNKQDNPEFAQENLELSNRIVNFVIEHFTKISKKQEAKLAFYEDFLIKNISEDTVVNLVNFVSGLDYKEENSFFSFKGTSGVPTFSPGLSFGSQSSKPTSDGLFAGTFGSGSAKPGLFPSGGVFTLMGSQGQKPTGETQKEKFEKATRNLKSAVEKYIQENITVLKEKKIAENCQ